MSGRGAWPANGAGGTKKYKDATKPGPYYYLGTGAKPVDGQARTNDEYAVWRAVVAYQAALNRRLGTNLLADGVLGDATSTAILKFQNLHPKTGTPWGGIGPDTSRILLRPDLKQIVLDNGNTLITVKIVSGTVRHESLWDAGAVGYLDESDLGLAQINGTAHPDLSRKERLDPLVAFQFIVNYYENALSQLSNNQRDAIASYNLGIGGAKRWISQGRPEWYTPEGETRARNVWQYIDSILAG